MSRHLLLAALVLGSATASAANNTQLNGVTLTNEISSFSDTSAFYNGPQLSTGIGYMTDNDISTYATNFGNLGAGGDSIQAVFSEAISAPANGIFIVGLAPGGSSTINGDFMIQLELTSGLTTARTYGDSDFVVTSQTVSSFDYYQNGDGSIVLNTVLPSAKYAYLFASFAEFNVNASDVIGIRLSGFTFQYPDLSYIGAGYSGAPPIPEPSTYGLILGGLALAGAAMRRRKKA